MFTARVFCLFIVSFTLIYPVNAALYPGETLMEAAGAQTLVYFSKADPTKPLMIFIPGDSHLARISYGYPGGKKQDFLSNSLNKKGYSFLGISYPLDNPVYSKVYPQFSIQDWGEQIVEVAQKIILKNNLSKKIVVLGWSMGGSIEQTLTASAKKHGLEVELFIGLSAVPPLPYVMQSGPFDTNIMRPNHLADRSALYPVFTSLLAEQNSYNQHLIIPKSIYLSEFLGHIPAAIAAEGYAYQNGHLLKNIPRTLKDGGVFNFSNTPWIGLIEDDSPTTAKISLIDPAGWNFLRIEMIYSQYLKNKDLTKLSPQKWSELSRLIDNMPHIFNLTVHGNHFFFVGEKGASDSADRVEELLLKVHEIKRQFKNLVPQTEESLRN